MGLLVEAAARRPATTHASRRRVGARIDMGTKRSSHSCRGAKALSGVNLGTAVNEVQHCNF
jgi:hypothetical protein